MTTSSNPGNLSGEAAPNLLAKDPFNISPSFSRWLQDIKAARNPLTGETAEVEEESSEIYIGSFPGSNCEVTFEGVLHFDGYSIGNISSPDGTLVLTKRGRIEADVDVKVAVINGWVTGNITARERVVLESEARVTGEIYTPALSVRLGAIFDGECVFSVPGDSFAVAEPSTKKRSNVFERLAVAVGA